MLSATQVIALVAKAAGQPVGHVLAPTRSTPEAALARQVAMYLIHVCLQVGQTRVADIFSRDRKAVHHALKAVEDLRSDPDFDAFLGNLEQQIAQGSLRVGLSSEPTAPRFNPDHRIRNRTWRAALRDY